MVQIAGMSRDVTVFRNALQVLEFQVQQRTEELSTRNEELAESISQLSHSNDELAQYAYVASHDLQEPLRKIKIFSTILNGQTNMPEKSMTVIRKISSSAERMSLLIKDLLDFSRLLKADILMRPVNLGDVMIAITGDFELMIEETGAIIEIGALPVIEAVSLQMNQLFYNLISNALKFRRAGESPKVTVHTEVLKAEEVARYISKPLPFAKYYHIILTDNGIGFETRYNEQIFEVFKRLHTRDVYPGSGIGLSLCRRIVATHNGHLYAESVADKGSTFHIILPDSQHEGVLVLPVGEDKELSL